MRHLRKRGKGVSLVLYVNQMKDFITAETNKSITSPQLAERWQCHVATIRRRQGEGLLKGFQIGIRWRFPLSDVLHAEQLLAANPARRRLGSAERRAQLLRGLAAALVSRKQKAAARQKAAASLQG